MSEIETLLKRIERLEATIVELREAADRESDRIVEWTARQDDQLAERLERRISRLEDRL